MSKLFKDKIMVIGHRNPRSSDPDDCFCFPVNPKTLEPTACGLYCSVTISDCDAVKTITYSELIKLREKLSLRR